jgi:CHAD domain-containing protein
MKPAGTGRKSSGHRRSSKTRESAGRAASHRDGKKTARTRPHPGETPGVTLEDTVSEAARKLLLFHLRAMIRHEPGTREGKDVEELHDMRVAVRRMRAVLQVLEGHLDRKALRPYRKALRTAGRRLGAVRDLDVFRQRADDHIETLPRARRAELNDLLEVWKKQKDDARLLLEDFMDGSKYRLLTSAFKSLLERPGSLARVWPADRGHCLVAPAVPAVLFSRLASVRAFDGEMRSDSPLPRYHRLRIAAKRLRYSLEFFREVLGPEAESMIDRLKGLQDHLGQLQDAAVASKILRRWLTSGVWEGQESDGKADGTGAKVSPGAAAWLAVRQEEINNLIERFPATWSPIARADFRSTLCRLVETL